MTTIMPQGELLKKAMAWILEVPGQDQDRRRRIDEAAMRFNLTPKDVECLLRLLEEQEPCR